MIIGDNMQKGFTLIELVAVVALLGVIMLVAIPSLIQTNKTTKTNEKAEYKSIVEEACETYIQINKEKDELKELFSANGKTYTLSTKNLVEEGYLKNSLKDPETGSSAKQAENNIIATNQNQTITCTYTG